MTKKKPDISGDLFAEETSDQKYVLRLYVAGMTPKSTRAIKNITRICEEHLAGRYDLQVIDIYQQPKLAKGEQIIAAPTLIKKLPVPLRKFIGSMADEEKILVGLDLRPQGKK
ncbi:MAG: circadian clock KaiB family protein [Anaerohalosphaeraceae bacterium]|jgi:circadian clock protein KaiB